MVAFNGAKHLSNSQEARKGDNARSSVRALLQQTGIFHVNLWKIAFLRLNVFRMSDISTTSALLALAP